MNEFLLQISQRWHAFRLIPDPEKAIKTFHEKGPNFQFPDFGMAGKIHWVTQGVLLV